MNLQRILILGLSFLLLALTACTGSDSPTALLDIPDPPLSEVSAYNPDTATARVFGAINFEGSPPELPPLRVGGSRFCVVEARGITSEEVLVTDDGQLENVIVYVRSGHAALSYPVPDEPVVLDQQLCVYVPHAFTIMAGQELTVRNSDDTFHNIHAMTEVNPVINFAQPVVGMENSVTFDRPEMPFMIGCDLHRWMGTWVGVFDHPFHTTSGDTGNYELRLPPGKYEIVAWHERYGERATSVEVGESAEVELDFSFTAVDSTGSAQEPNPVG